MMVQNEQGSWYENNHPPIGDCSLMLAAAADVEIERLLTKAEKDKNTLLVSLEAATKEIERLRSILRRILKHIEDGTLVRDISKDAEAEWVLPMMRLVVDLKDASEAVRAREATR